MITIPRNLIDQWVNFSLGADLVSHGFFRCSGFWALMSVLCFSAWYSVEPKSPMTGKSCGYFSRDQSGYPMGSVCLKWGDDFHNNEYIPPGYHGELVFECNYLPLLDLTNVVNLEKRLPSPQRCDP